MYFTCAKMPRLLCFQVIVLRVALCSLHWESEQYVSCSHLVP